MKKLISCEFNIASACVELHYSDGSMLAIYCDAVEDEYAKTIRQRSALDYLVYNATIDDPIHSIDELIAKDALFADFKAVKSGDVWCTGKALFQATDITGSMIVDFHNMLCGEGDMTFLYKLA